MLVRRPAGVGRDRRHRLVAGWDAPGDHVLTSRDARRPDKRCTSRTRMGPASASWPHRRGCGRSASRPSVGMAWSPDGTRLAYTNLSGSDRDPSFTSGRPRSTAQPLRWSRRECCVTGGAGVPRGPPTAHRSPSSSNTKAAPPTSIWTTWSSTPTERASRRRSTSSRTAVGTVVGTSAPATGESYSTPASARRHAWSTGRTRSLGWRTETGTTTWQPGVRRRDDLWSSQSSWSSCPGAPDPPRATRPRRSRQARAPRHPDSATAEPVSDVLTGGRYLFGPFEDKRRSVSIEATGPDGWVGYPDLGHGWARARAR